MRILWLKTELLHPVDKGGKIRTYHMLRALRRRHQITYLALDDGTAAEDAELLSREYCDELVPVRHFAPRKFTASFYADLVLGLGRPLPYAIRKYSSDRMRSRIEAMAHEHSFDVVVCDFLAPSVNVPHRLPCATVLFEHNVEATLWKRHAEVCRGSLARAYLRREYRLMRRYEATQCRRFDRVITVSPADADRIRTEYGVEAVDDVPTGVDVTYFRPAPGVLATPDSLVFTGSMDWLPNEDAVRFFVLEVMPLVARARPNVTLTIVGRKPSPRLVELVRGNPAITVTGGVDDVRAFIQRAAACIVPVRIGGGTRLKIFEAMAMECPIVSTTVGAEGLPVKNGRDLLIADSVSDFAAAVVSVLSDPARARSMAERAAWEVREHFGWDRVAERFTEICARAVRPVHQAAIA